MNRRYLKSSVLMFALLCFIASGFMATNTAQAQNRRADGLYIRAKIGASSYAGDRDNNPENNLSEFFENQIGFPGVGLEFGFAGSLSDFLRYSAALTYMGAQYNLINRPFAGCPDSPDPRIDRPCPDLENSSMWRHTGGVVFGLGFWPSATVMPYLRLGAAATYGQVVSQTNTPDDDLSDFEMSYGPIGGIGVDIAVSDRVGLFLEATSFLSFPDDNTDLTSGLEEDWDVLSTYGVGLRFTFDTPFTPVNILAIDGPMELLVGEEGTFTATVNAEEATPPLTYRWEFGNGATGTGLLATYSYPEPGTYEVTFIASNEGSTARQSMTVEVNPRPVPAEIVDIGFSPQTPEAGESVNFSAEVRGDEPIDCLWEFGDGATSEECEPVHAYEEPGTYTATLTLQNEFGEDMASVTVNVEEAVPAVCMTITELNSVYFAPNTSTLSEEAMTALEENIEILEQCPNICVRIVGYAAPGERNPEDLAEARAQAVMDFYTEAGIEADRFTVEVEGVPGGITTKKGAGAQYRRVDSIPGDCDMMMGM